MKIAYRPLAPEIIAQAKEVKPGRAPLDLAEYKAALEFAKLNDNAVGVTIDEGDSIKAVRGRFTKALREIDPNLTIRYLKSDEANTLNILIETRDPNAKRRGRKPKSQVEGETGETADNSTSKSKSRKGELTAV